MYLVAGEEPLVDQPLLAVEADCPESAEDAYPDHFALLEQYVIDHRFLDGKLIQLVDVFDHFRYHVGLLVSLLKQLEYVVQPGFLVLSDAVRWNQR